MEQIKHRFLLVSDMHDTTEETHEELKKIYPEANTSIAAGDAFGHTQREKIEKVYEAVIGEHAKHPLDGVLILGDLSIDDWDSRHLPLNYCRKFKEDCMDRLPCPSYAQPGNHDSYPDEMWREVFGYDRQFVVEFGDTVFVMADTFQKVPAKGASGSPYNPVDEDFLRSELEKYKGKNVFLCAHHINKKDTDELCEVIRNSPELKCMFRGHTHHNAVIDMGEECGNKPLVDIGGYAYNGMVIDGKYTFGIFDEKWAWGYEILELTETTAHLYHVKPDMHYVADNGTFDVPHTVSGEFEIKLK